MPVLFIDGKYKKTPMVSKLLIGQYLENLLALSGG